MEIYRYLIDDFLIDYCMNLNSQEFITKTESIGRKKQGKREYLNDKKTHDFLKKLGKHLGSTINISRIKVGKKQAIETLINEESLLFAKYLRRERKKWIPRLA